MARSGTDRETEAARLVDEASDGVESTSQEVTVGEETLSVVTQEAEFIGARFVLWSPDGADATYSVVLYGPPPQAETDPERLEELAQLVGSLEYDGRPL